MVPCEDTTMTMWNRLLWITLGGCLAGLIAILVACMAGGPWVGWKAVITIWYALKAYTALVALVLALVGIHWVLTSKRDADRGPR